MNDLTYEEWLVICQSLSIWSEKLRSIGHPRYPEVQSVLDKAHAIRKELS